VTVGAKVGEAYPVKFDHKAAPEAQGIAVQKELAGDRLLWVAFGPPKTVALGVYEIKGDTLVGQWYPWYYDGMPKNAGTESLKGPENLNGEFTITAAQAPFTGAAYTGTVNIKPVEIVGAPDSEKPFELVWTIGDKKIYGFGIKTKNYLYVCAGSGSEAYLANLVLDSSGTMIGNWYDHKHAMGYYTTSKKN
jgi:hypothetical protein